ncbi:MAG: hypothetical protein HDS57_05270 [Barnesiella sp.]|nr:hypothetical protein [Barnesiella sp.]MBD5374127.1 hypothetical protein [Bacteroides sp.]
MEKKGIADRVADFFSKLGSSSKSVVKLAVSSHHSTMKSESRDDFLVVMGNGPSLADTMARYGGRLSEHPLLAVNFAAATEEFFALRPCYYVMADPVFFDMNGNENLKRLRDNLLKVDWPMTLFVPFGPADETLPGNGNVNITVVRFNCLGVEGFEWLENLTFRWRRAMPRPRNVLIPALMLGLWLGYKEIYVAGADHSWTRTLEVDEDNTVISVQPHFYKDNEAEHERVRSVYRNIRLHEIIYSFYVAFKAYFAVERFARSCGAVIYNSTPGSFIDAFPRREIPER